MCISQIHTNEDYDDAVYLLLQLDGTENQHRFSELLEDLTLKIADYEAAYCPIEFCDPIEAIQSIMHWRDYDKASFLSLVGDKEEAELMLTKKKPLPLPVLWKLIQEWNVPAPALLKPYELALGQRPQ